jgi:hypothetical protein
MRGECRGFIGTEHLEGQELELFEARTGFHGKALGFHQTI